MPRAYLSNFKNPTFKLKVNTQNVLMIFLAASRPLSTPYKFQPRARTQIHLFSSESLASICKMKTIRFLYRIVASRMDEDGV